MAFELLFNGKTREFAVAPPPSGYLSTEIKRESFSSLIVAGHLEDLMCLNCHYLVYCNIIIISKFLAHDNDFPAF